MAVPEVAAGLGVRVVLAMVSMTTSAAELMARLRRKRICVVVASNNLSIPSKPGRRRGHLGPKPARRTGRHTQRGHLTWHREPSVVGQNTANMASARLNSARLSSVRLSRGVLNLTAPATTLRLNSTLRPNNLIEAARLQIRFACAGRKLSIVSLRSAEPHGRSWTLTPSWEAWTNLP